MIQDLLFILETFLIISAIVSCGIIAYWFIVTRKMAKYAEEHCDMYINPWVAFSYAIMEPCFYIPIANLAWLLKACLYVDEEEMIKNACENLSKDE